MDSSSFITASFVITLRSIRLGVLPLIKLLEALSKANHNHEHALNTDEAKQRLERARSSAIFYLSNKQCLLEPLGQFYKFAVQWFTSAILRTGDSVVVDEEALISPASRNIFLEDLLEILVWLAAASAMSLEVQQAPWTLTLLHTFHPLLFDESLGSLIISCLEGKVVSNPHLISKWAEVSSGCLTTILLSYLVFNDELRVLECHFWFFSNHFFKCQISSLIFSFFIGLLL